MSGSLHKISDSTLPLSPNRGLEVIIAQRVKVVVPLSPRQVDVAPSVRSIRTYRETVAVERAVLAVGPLLAVRNALGAEYAELRIGGSRSPNRQVHASSDKKKCVCECASCVCVVLFGFLFSRRVE